MKFWYCCFISYSTNCSGDQDSVIPLTGSRTLVHGLAEELGLNTTVPYRVWFEGKQVSSIIYNMVENLISCRYCHSGVQLKMFLVVFRLVGGHKCMVTFSPLPPLEEHPMKLHSLSQRDHLFCSGHFWVVGLYHKLSDLLISFPAVTPDWDCK